jgi:SAM-dependent methyltransferase
MADARDSSARTEKLIAELQARVEERRREGAYPPGFEEDLDAHFHRIVSQRHGDIDAVRASLARLEAAMAFNRDRIPLQSNLKGGSAAHKTIAKIVGRQTQGVLEQMREFAEAVHASVEGLLGLLENPGTHEHTELIGELDAVIERIAQYDRVPPSEIADAGLHERVAALEQAEARRAFNPWFSNDSFEEAFRGSREDLRRTYADVADRFIGAGPVLDIGCGRGEFLELLRERDVPGRGVEIDPALVKEAQELGLDVELNDGLNALGAVKDGTLGGIVLIQVVEHLTPQEVVDLVALAYEKLRPQGRILVETVNPQSLYVFAHSLYVDPTHARPVHPAYLDFLFRQAGYAHVEIHWRSPIADAERLEENGDGEGDTTSNANVRRLNELVFGPQDYAIIALR